MALLPSRVKYRKQQRGSRKGLAKSGNQLSFGEYGLMALDRCWLKSNQIEAARIAINRNIKRRGKMWIRVFPDKPVSKKPAEVRMGKGKAAPEFWVAVIKPGRIIYELEGVPESLARESMALAAAKLPIKCKFVSRHSG